MSILRQIFYFFSNFIDWLLWLNTGNIKNCHTSWALKHWNLFKYCLSRVSKLGFKFLFARTKSRLSNLSNNSVLISNLMKIYDIHYNSMILIIIIHVRKVLFSDCLSMLMDFLWIFPNPLNFLSLPEIITSL